eukprot:PhM_4_TR3023/c0_g1_i1/m.41449
MLWHGYLGEEEWDPAWTTFIMVMLNSIPSLDYPAVPTFILPQTQQRFTLKEMLFILRHQEGEEVSSSLSSSLSLLPSTPCPTPDELISNPFQAMGYHGQSRTAGHPTEAIALVEWRLNAHLAGPLLNVREWRQSLGCD